MKTFGDQLQRIRRNWWVVAALALLGLVAGVGLSLVQHTTYTGRAALIVSSNGRSPDQDAVLVQGYVDYFNADGYQPQILAAAHVPPGTAVTARTAAASPIMLVEATADDAEAAGRAATNVAESFRVDMNKVRSSGTADAVNTVKAKLTRAQAAAGPNPDAATIADIASLQNELQSLQSDQTNQLQLLQPDGGVATISAPLLKNAAFGLVGGLLAGCIAALALAGIRGNLVTEREVAEATGLDTLASLPATTDGTARRSALRRLAVIVSSAGLAERPVVAIVAPGQGAVSPSVAEDLCENLSSGPGTVQLVRAAEHGAVAELPGAGERDTDTPAKVRLLDVGVGTDATVGAATVLRRLDHVRSRASWTLVDAIAAPDAASSAALCAVADATILLVGQSGVRPGEAAEFTALLHRAGANVLGAVAVAPEPRARFRRIAGLRHVAALRGFAAPLRPRGAGSTATTATSESA